jgi:hypothetical protein
MPQVNKLETENEQNRQTNPGASLLKDKSNHEF